MRTFEFNDDTSHKFWSIDVQGNTFTVTFGRIGTAGQTQRKSFASSAAAQAAANKLIAEKTKKGYVEVAVARSLPAEERAFEKSLIENPDDGAGWRAFADYLTEQGAPRGEFMQVQLALEDESRPKKERDALKKQEKEIFAEYEKEWLGGLAQFVYEQETPEGYETGSQAIWEHGVLSGLVVEQLSAELAHTLVLDPAAQFVRELRVHRIMDGYGPHSQIQRPVARVKTPTGVRGHSELYELIGSPFLANLRVFQYGNDIPAEDGWCDCHTYHDGLEYVIAGMDRIEVLDLYCKSYNLAAVFALKNLSHLRELRVYHLGGHGRRHGHSPIFALDVLAQNPAFANLTHLLFHPHQPEDTDDNLIDMSYIPLEQVRALVNSPLLKKLTHLQLRLSDMGDDGIREIVASGILKQLKWLDLRHGCVTDEGAALLAACPDAKRLDRIDLSRNAVTAKGLALLRKAGVNAVANKPLTDEELNERHYLREGDFE